ncbi:MAG: PDZ domain-containing protein [Planctomycetota bacterium]|jgi:hypothetical protein
MSVGALKKLLVILNIGAVLALAATAWGFWGHRQYLQGPHEWPDFAFTAAVLTDEVGQIGDISMTLGLFPKKVEVAKTTEEEKVEAIVSVLDRLGKITGAIAPENPFAEGSSNRAAIIFKLNDGGKIRILALGEAIETRPHPKYRGAEFAIPYRYKFVACRRDEKNPDTMYFDFDMKCDGTDIQSVTWKNDMAGQPLQRAGALPAGGENIKEITGRGFTIVSEAELERQKKEEAERKKKADEEAAKAKTEEKPTKVEEVKVNPDQVLPTIDDVPDDFYEERDGTWLPTNQGSEYLKENWKNIVEEARTSTYRNPDTGAKEGVLITRIKRGSVASKFGIYPDDVIQMINGRTVRSKSEAINVVKNEIDVKKRKIIEVRILRNGKPFVKRYDTRDPDTRKAARDLR